MPRYIDAEWEEKYWTKCLHHPTPDVTENDIKHAGAIIDALQMAKTADVVEVVRCGSCKWLQPDGKCKVFADYQIRPSASDYCSYGIRGES